MKESRAISRSIQLCNMLVLNPGWKYYRQKEGKCSLVGEKGLGVQKKWDPATGQGVPVHQSSCTVQSVCVVPGDKHSSFSMCIFPVFLRWAQRECSQVGWVWGPRSSLTQISRNKQIQKTGQKGGALGLHGRTGLQFYQWWVQGLKKIPAARVG